MIIVFFDLLSLYGSRVVAIKFLSYFAPCSDGDMGTSTYNHVKCSSVAHVATLVSEPRLAIGDWHQLRALVFWVPLTKSGDRTECGSRQP
jgi:hypothetical protein